MDGTFAGPVPKWRDSIFSSGWQKHGTPLDVISPGSGFGTAMFEISVAIRLLYAASAMPSQSPGMVLPSTPGRISIYRRQPLGVVGVISPFNFPFYLSLRAVAPALAIGEPG